MTTFWKGDDDDSDSNRSYLRGSYGRQGPKGLTQEERFDKKLQEQIGQLEKKLQETTKNKTVKCGICLQEAEGLTWSSRNKIDQRMCFDCLYDQALATFAMKSWDGQGKGEETKERTLLPQSSADS